MQLLSGSFPCTIYGSASGLSLHLYSKSKDASNQVADPLCPGEPARSVAGHQQLKGGDRVRADGSEEPVDGVHLRCESRELTGHEQND